MFIFLYVLFIVVSNFITALPPLHFGMFIIPNGSWLIGATFILRDLVQNKYGKKCAYFVIFTALFLSIFSTFILKNVLIIVFASAIAFLASESLDTEIYSRFKTTFLKRVVWSGIFSGILDSAIFVVIGLSPLFTNMIPWNFVINAILGQVIVKIIMQFVGIGFLKSIKFKEIK